MIDVFEKYATDEKKEISGAEVSLGGGTTILVARLNNDNHAARIHELCELNREILDNDDEEARKLDKDLFIQVLAETVLLGWKNLSYKGKKLTYSKSNAMTLLAMRDFRNMVIAEASKFDNFKAKAEESDIKN